MRPVIFAFGMLLALSCNRETEFNAILLEGPAPTEVQANITFNNNEAPFSVTVRPTAIGATAFEVFSGIPGDATELVGLQRELTFLYPMANENFFVTINAIAPNDNVTEQRFEVVPPADPCVQILSAPLTWDNGNDPAFSFGFNGVELQVVANPDASGANPEVSNVLEIVQDGGGNFDGFGMQLTSPALFSAADKTVRINFWSNVQVPVRMTVQQDPNNETEREAEVNVIHSGTGWEELRFDFSTATAGFTGNPDGALGIPDFSPFAPTGQYIRVQMFISPGDDVSGTFYLDNVGVCPGGGSAPPDVPVEADPCTSIFAAPVTWDDGAVGEFSFGFNGVELEVVANPDPTGANSEVSNVLQITQDGGGDFDGLGVQMTATANFSEMDKVVRLKFWSDVETTVRLSMQQDPNNGTEREAVVNLIHTGNGWEELRYDFSTAIAGFTGSPDGALGIADDESFVPTGEYIRFQLFIAPGNDVAGTFYLDDVGICPE